MTTVLERRPGLEAWPRKVAGTLRCAVARLGALHAQAARSVIGRQTWRHPFSFAHGRARLFVTTAVTPR